MPAPTPDQSPSSRPPTIRWIGDARGHLEILDQRLLPLETTILRLNTLEEVWHAIRTLSVRGAPAIGIAAAFGMFLAARTVDPTQQAAQLIEALTEKARYLKSARPTAVNLEWAADQMLRLAITERAIGVRQLQQRLLIEANALLEEDRRRCLAIGNHGVSFIRPNSGILTHCNAGALATADHGTALAILYEAQRRKIPFHVFVDETRPLLQGARLTAWELAASGVDAALICDSMAGLLMKQGKIDLVIVGADRIAANGDTANKIGTYSLAVLAKAHNIPLIVAAPTSSFDLSLETGSGIPIEERPPEEITESFGRRTAPAGIKAYNPAFDITPPELIHAIVTEHGVIRPVNTPAIRKMVDR